MYLSALSTLSGTGETYVPTRESGGTLEAQLPSGVRTEPRPPMTLVRFLANVNSLYAIAVQSVVCLSVTLVRPT